MMAFNSIQILTGIQLLLGVWCWFYRLLYGHKSASHSSIEWKTSNSNFLIFLWVCAVIILFFPLMFRSLTHSLETPWNSFSGGFLAQFCLLIFLLLLCTRREWDFPQQLQWKASPLKQSLRTIFFEYLKITPVLFLLSVIWLAPLYWFQRHWKIDFQQQPLAQAILQTSSITFLVVAALMATIIAPITEELLFRGGLYRFLKGKISTKKAIWLTSLVFALLHYNFLAFLPILFLGVFLTQIYERHQNLWISIAVHSLFNLNSFVLLLLSRSIENSL